MLFLSIIVLEEEFIENQCLPCKTATCDIHKNCPNLEDKPFMVMIMFESSYGIFQKKFYHYAGNDELIKNDYHSQCYEPKSLFKKDIDMTAKSESWRYSDKGKMATTKEALDKKKSEFDPLQRAIHDLYNPEFRNTVIVTKGSNMKYIFRSIMDLGLPLTKSIIHSEEQITSMDLPRSETIRFVASDQFFDLLDFPQEKFIPHSMVKFALDFVGQIPDEKWFILQQDSKEIVEKKRKYVQSFNGLEWNMFVACMEYLNEENLRLLKGCVDTLKLTFEMQNALQRDSDKDLPMTSVFNYPTLVSFGKALLASHSLVDATYNLRACPNFENGTYT